jgi:hypothetical protein
MAPSTPAQVPVVSWRYALFAIGIAAALVAVVLVGVFDRPSSISPNSPCALECRGLPMAIGTPVAGGGPGNYSYDMGVVAQQGLVWGNVLFAIVLPNGNAIGPPTTWTVLIFNAGATSGTPVATYGFHTDNWTSGATAVVTSGQTIHLQLGATDLRGQGDRFVSSILSGPEHRPSGTTAVPLP